MTNGVHIEHSIKNLRLLSEYIRCIVISLIVFDIFNVKMCPSLLGHPVLKIVENTHHCMVQQFLGRDIQKILLSALTIRGLDTEWKGFPFFKKYRTGISCFTKIPYVVL